MSATRVAVLDDGGRGAGELRIAVLDDGSGGAGLLREALT